MSIQGKYLSFKIYIGFLTLMLLVSISYSMVVGNWSECGVEPGCDGGEKVSGTGVNLGVYVVQGAGHFLNSYSSWNTFLNRVEMAELNGLDYRELREVLYNAIEEMEKANAVYSDLSAAAAKSSYVKPVIDCLIAFDYKTFQKENGLNSDIFSVVKRYLEIGDIRGVYNALLINTGIILEKLYEVKQYVDTDAFPGIQGIWKTNQDYAEISLFGQYTAQVFYAVLYSK